MDNNLKILAASFSIVFMAYAIRYAFSMLLPEMMQDINLTNVQAGLIYTSFLTLYTLTSVFIGFLIDVKGIKRTVLAFLPLLGIGTSLMSLISSQITGLLFFGIAGVGASVCWTPIAVWVQKAYQLKRGWALGILQIGVSSGFGILGLAIPSILPYLGWRGCWALLGIIALTWLVPLTAVAPEPNLTSHSSKTLTEHLEGFGALLKDKKFWLGGLSYMFMSFGIMIPMTFSKAYANLELGIDASTSTLLFSVIGFSGILSALTIPIISDKIGRRPSIVICNLIAALGMIGTAFASVSFMVMVLWSILVGIGYGGMWPLYAAVSKDLFDWKVVGSVMGLWTLLCGIGLLLSPFLSGLLIDQASSYKPVYIIGSGVAVTSVFLVATIKCSA